MSSRADFYLGRGKDASWLGSIRFAGDPDSLPPSLLAARTEADFCRELVILLTAHPGGVRPDAGWPWRWKDSAATAYTYAFCPKTRRVWCCVFGKLWFDPLDIDFWDDAEPPVFPRMKPRTRKETT